MPLERKNFERKSLTQTNPSLAWFRSEILFFYFPSPFISRWGRGGLFHSLLSSLFLHTFFVCQFWLSCACSQEENFPVIFRIIFIVIFLFGWTWIEYECWTLSWSAKNTHRRSFQHRFTQHDISTHISDLQMILFAFSSSCTVQIFG